MSEPAVEREPYRPGRPESALMAANLLGAGRHAAAEFSRGPNGHLPELRIRIEAGTDDTLFEINDAAAPLSLRVDEDLVGRVCRLRIPDAEPDEVVDESDGKPRRLDRQTIEELIDYLETVRTGGEYAFKSRPSARTAE